MEHGLTIDWTIKFGDIMVLLGIAAAGIAMSFRIGKFSQTIDYMQVEIKALHAIAQVISDLLTKIAVQKVEIQNIREDIDEMKHGKGFVIGREFSK